MSGMLYMLTVLTIMDEVHVKTMNSRERERERKRDFPECTIERKLMSICKEDVRVREE